MKSKTEKQHKTKLGKPKEYNHLAIEKKWQKQWESSKIYKTLPIGKAKKYYVLDMFPYPSGAGLHVGHPRGYIASDVFARMKRMQGFNVLHPMGFDSFGLPAEQYAIQTKKHPGPFTDKLVKQYKKQLEIIGFSYDWDRSVSTHTPEYYKWTQWIFLKLYNAWYDKRKDKARDISDLIKIFAKEGNENINAVCDSNVQIFSAKDWKSFNEKEREDLLMKYRLAHEGFAEVNWCEELGTVLANDEILDGPNGTLVSERGGYPVIKKSMRQWFMRITAFADRLLSDIEDLDWPQSIKEIQKNWIGKSEGSEIEFQTTINRKIKVFTTRADTLLGVTYVVLSPEHTNIGEFLVQAKNMAEVSEYVREAKERAKKEDITIEKEKTGVELKGVKAINPVNGEEVPVWVADYVLANYGTGAVMAVPAHDERDFEFAKKYNLPIKTVIQNPEGESDGYTGYGKLINSGQFNGLTSEEAKTKITEFVGGKIVTKYKMRDAIFARQRYWGEPIPLRRVSGKKQKVLIIHGLGGSAKSDWMPWMKKELEKEGFDVRVPTMKTSFHPTIDSWLKELSPLIKDFNENDIIIGHSIGSNAALRLLLKTKKKIGNLYLVASAIGSIDERDWDKFKKDDPDSDIEALRAFWTAPLDIEKAGSFARNVTLILSEDDPDIPRHTHEGLPEKWELKVWSGFEHFNESQIPQLRDEFLKAKNSYWSSLPENKLPLKLPNVKSYEPAGTGESPLASVSDWVKKGFETNTMPGWAGSSWYFLRYMDPKNKKEFANKKDLNYWQDVDMYVGGSEHATGHLLYSRFWHKFLYDMNLVPTKEPFKALRNQGMILATDGRKMSKRWGNVINPDDIVKTYGADTLRVYEMFMGPFDQSLPWSTESIIGSRRFLEKVWRTSQRIDVKKYQTTSPEVERALHKTIKKVTEDISNFNFNTAISSMMICANEFEKSETISKNDFLDFLKILTPFAPHIAEEIWHSLGEKGSIHRFDWPKYDPEKIAEKDMKIVVQVNGKVRGTLTIDANASEKEIEQKIFGDEKILPWLSGTVLKIIHVKNKLVNFVVKQ